MRLNRQRKKGPDSTFDVVAKRQEIPFRRGIVAFNLLRLPLNLCQVSQ